MIYRTALGLGSSITVLVSVALIWSASAKEKSDDAFIGELDIVEGKALYLEVCASCHGANLEGQQNWQSPGDDGRLPAPPHDETGHTWHHGDQVLFAYTKLGGKALMAGRGMNFNSGMPGFGDQLSDQEIWNILEYIKSTWPQRLQEMQAVRTESETRMRGN